MSKVMVSKVCSVCGQYAHVAVDAAGYERWVMGELIQRALPDLTPDQREMVKTGIHPKCWDAMFPEEEE